MKSGLLLNKRNAHLDRYLDHRGTIEITISKMEFKSLQTHFTRYFRLPLNSHRYAIMGETLVFTMNLPSYAGENVRGFLDSLSISFDVVEA